MLIVIAGWTSFALRKQGNKKIEITEVLQKMLTNSKDLTINFGKLVLLLIKDALKNNFEGVETQEESLNMTPSGFTGSKDDGTHIETETDEAIKGFSPEVIELISEEEEKVA